MSELHPGATFASYTVEQVAGRGGMGVVYRARQTGLDRLVALKVIAPEHALDAAFRDRFNREARMAAMIDHPNVVPVYEAGQAEGQLFLAMRFVQGRDVADLLANEGRMAPQRAVSMIAGIGSALDAAHARGLVHRDIKPSNILVASDNEHVYLTDFGLTKEAEDGSMTQTGQVIGTPDYLSPEQIKGGSATIASDVYALGCVLYAALTGESPFKRSSVTATMLAHLNDPVATLPPDVPAALNGVLEKALAKEPGDRFHSCGLMVDAAWAALEGAEVADRPASVGRRPPTGAASAVGSRSGSATAAVAPPEKQGPNKALAILLPALLGIGLIAALLAAAGVFSGGDDKKSDSAVTTTANTDTPTPTSTASGGGAPQVVNTIDVGGSPDGIGVTEDSVYVADSTGKDLIRIDPKHPTAEAERVEAGDSPDSIAGGKGVVWVSVQGENALARLTDTKQADGSVKTTKIKNIPVGKAPEGVSLAPQVVWVALRGENRVARVDRSTTNLINKIPTGSKPLDVFVGSDFVWTANNGDATVTQIDLSTSAVVNTIKVADRPAGIVEAFGSVWVACASGKVVRIDAKTGKVQGDPIDVGGEPSKIAAGLGKVWVTDRQNGVVIPIDPSSGQPQNQIVVGNKPVGVVTGFGSVWVSNSANHTVAQIK